MEKYIVFGPMILFLGFFAILVIAFLAFIIKLVIKSKNSYWKGEVIEKKYFQKRDDHKIEEFFSVVLRTTDNKDMKVAVSKILYNNIKEGDTLEKVKGSLYPKKV